METTLLHSSGEWIASKLSIGLTKQDPQAIGSAISYARRYSLSAILGVSAEDDDAEAATDHDKTEKATTPTPTESAEKVHWCKEHNTAFIRHENAKGVWYSHEQGDVWCREDKGKAKADTIPVIAPPLKAKPDVIPDVIIGESYWPGKEGAVNPSPSDTEVDDIIQQLTDANWNKTATLNSWLSTSQKIAMTALAGKTLREVVVSLNHDQRLALRSKLKERAELR